MVRVVVLGGGSPATVRTERQQREQPLQRPIPVSVPRSRDIQSFGVEDTEDRPQRDDKRHPVTYFFLFHASDICSHFSQRGAPTAPAPALGSNSSPLTQLISTSASCQRPHAAAKEIRSGHQVHCYGGNFFFLCNVEAALELRHDSETDTSRSQRKILP